MTRWPGRRLAGWLRARGISVSRDPVTVLWRRSCLAPHRTGGFQFPAGPQPEARVRDVAGLHLAPADNAVAVCADETPQIQALDRTQPVLPMRPGSPARHTHDHIRHGTTALSAALQVATGTVTDAGHPRRRHGEFLTFLNKAAAACPSCEPHVICGNHATHTHAGIRAWLARPQNQRITLHLVPASCSWLNLVQCSFPVITRPAIRRGSCASVSELISATGAFIDHRNKHPRPFSRTKNADEILAKIQRAKTKTSSLTHH